MEQSRRACPELVERGRLKITQDASPGYPLSCAAIKKVTTSDRTEAKPKETCCAPVSQTKAAEPVLHTDQLFARIQRLNTYEAKTNTMTTTGSNLSQVLPPPISCE
jgi:hypothetical protein